MDSSTVVMPPLPFFPSRESRISSNSVTVGRGKPAIGILSSGFVDQGHLRYYSSRIRGFPSSSTAMMAVIYGKEDKAMKDRTTKKMKKKQQLKLLKGLSRDLSSFSQMDFGFDSEALVDQVNRGMMSEAADLLLERLQKLSAEEKELKRKMKEEKARLKASQMQTRQMDCEESLSSSSESSNSECDEVVNVKSLKQAQFEQNGLKQLTIDKENSLPTTPITPAAVDHLGQSDVAEARKLAVENCTAVNPTCSKKIEVCMGGKCKKSGAVALMAEFKKVIGMEDAVSGCKCMGKCKEGPNVKVLNSIAASGDSMGPQPQPQPQPLPQGPSLCIGVGLEDVDMIVSKFLGQNQNNNQMGFAAAS